MVENLRSKKYANGQALEYKKNATKDSDKFYCYPVADTASFQLKPSLGLLYTWAAASNGVASDFLGEVKGGLIMTDVAGTVSSQVQGICPDGWVLPSDKDWTDLEREITVNATQYSMNPNDLWKDSWAKEQQKYRGKRHGRAIKSRLQVNGLETHGLSNSNGTGFDALLVARTTTGDVTAQGGSTSFWSGSEFRYTMLGMTVEVAWSRTLSAGSDAVYRGFDNKFSYQSVRCKKK